MAPAPVAAATPAAPYDGTYAGVLGKQQFQVKLVNGTRTGSWLNTTCSKDVTFTLTIEPNGKALMRTRGFNKQCELNQFPNSHVGLVTNNQIDFSIKTSAGQDAKVTFTRR